MFEVEYFTLSSVDSTNEYVSLDGYPVVSTNVALDVISGTAQALSNGNGDFGVDGTRILWDNINYGLNQEGLSTGDKLRVIYDKS